MKLFKVESPLYDEGYFYNMTRTGTMKSNIHYININEISCVYKYVGDLLHEGWICSLVIMKNNDKFIDKRDIETILEDISKFN